MTIYLDCNASTPIDPRVAAEVLRTMTEGFGNAASRTHEFGLRAHRAASRARAQLAAVVAARPEEVIFTSGATESNNLALRGLMAHGLASGRKHIISTQIEHHAVLEPLKMMVQHGFTVDLVAPQAEGWVEPQAILERLRPDTLLLSVMYVNNETGVIQPIEELAAGLVDPDLLFHVDAAQGFGKLLGPLRHPRLDLISISAHKLCGPPGIGALIIRSRQGRRPPLTPLQVGGGQERGLRSGTVPVPLAVGFGLAAELATTEIELRRRFCQTFGERLRRALVAASPCWLSPPERTLYNTLSVRFPGLDSEAVMLALKPWVAISNGSACTSARYETSHVLRAMGLSEAESQEALRFSWCHLTQEPDWLNLTNTLLKLR